MINRRLSNNNILRHLSLNKNNIFKQEQYNARQREIKRINKTEFQ